MKKWIERKEHIRLSHFDCHVFVLTKIRCRTNITLWSIPLRIQFTHISYAKFWLRMRENSKYWRCFCHDVQEKCHWIFLEWSFCRRKVPNIWNSLRKIQSMILIRKKLRKFIKKATGFIHASIDMEKSTLGWLIRHVFKWLTVWLFFLLTRTVFISVPFWTVQFALTTVNLRGSIEKFPWLLIGGYGQTNPCLYLLRNQPMTERYSISTQCVLSLYRRYLEKSNRVFPRMKGFGTIKRYVKEKHHAVAIRTTLVKSFIYSTFVFWVQNAAMSFHWKNIYPIDRWALILFFQRKQIQCICH